MKDSYLASLFLQYRCNLFQKLMSTTTKSLKKEPFFSESSLLNGDWHKGRQLLKKLSRSSNGGLSLALASTTSASEQETFIQQKSLLEENDDKSFGESGKMKRSIEMI